MLYINTQNGPSTMWTVKNCKQAKNVLNCNFPKDANITRCHSFHSRPEGILWLEEDFGKHWFEHLDLRLSMRGFTAFPNFMLSKRYSANFGSVSHNGSWLLSQLIKYWKARWISCGFVWIIEPSQELGGFIYWDQNAIFLCHNRSYTQRKTNLCFCSDYSLIPLY